MTGHRLFFKGVLCFNTMPCRHMPLLVHFSERVCDLQRRSARLPPSDFNFSKHVDAVPESGVGRCRCCVTCSERSPSSEHGDRRPRGSGQAKSPVCHGAIEPRLVILLDSRAASCNPAVLTSFCGRQYVPTPIELHMLRSRRYVYHMDDRNTALLSGWSRLHA